MIWILGALAWLTASFGAALWIGRTIKLADEALVDCGPEADDDIPTEQFYMPRSWVA